MSAINHPQVECPSPPGGTWYLLKIFTIKKATTGVDDHVDYSGSLKQSSYLADVFLDVTALGVRTGRHLGGRRLAGHLGNGVIDVNVGHGSGRYVTRRHQHCRITGGNKKREYFPEMNS